MSPIISFSGIASGIDSKSLIAALIDRQRAASVTPLSNKVTELKDTNESLTKLKSLLNAVKDSAYTFRAISGGSVSKNVTSSSETVATASALKSANAGSYSIAVSQVASNGTSSFSDRFSSSNAIINSSIDNQANSALRTVSVTVGSGASAETVDVELTNSTTAAEFVASFNASSTKAESSLVNVGTSSSPSYAIVITSKKSGVDQGQVTISTGSEIETAGSGALNDSAVSSTQARNAIFSISGVGTSIERGSNQITDVISGLTINLNQIGSSLITVESDPEDTKKSIQKFIDSYNEVVSFIRENDAVSSSSENGETNNTFGPLSGVSIDESVLSSLRNSFSQSSKSGGLVNTLSDLGITTQRDGTLGFNQATFDSAFNSESSSVETILTNLGEKLAAVDGTISQFTQYNGLIDVVINGGNSNITSSQNRIYDLENGFTKQENALTAQFARLESLIGKLNQQQSTLSSLLR